MFIGARHPSSALPGAADVQHALTADEREVCPQLEEELRDVLHERSLHCPLLSVVAEAEEVEPVGLLEALPREIRVRFGQPSLEVRERRAVPLHRLGFNLEDQN